MTATNHALTGAIIGLSLHQPLLAIPAAFVSHYALDSLPHSGGLWPVASRNFTKYLFTDAGMCFLLVLALAITQPAYWLLAIICAFTATSPDFMWVKKYQAAQSGKPEPMHKLWFVRLHKNIQWFQRPIGVVVEVAWAAAAVTVLATIIKS